MDSRANVKICKHYIFCIYKHTYIYENIQLTIHKFIPNVSQFHQAYRIASFWVFCKFVGNI